MSDSSFPPATPFPHATPLVADYSLVPYPSSLEPSDGYLQPRAEHDGELLLDARLPRSFAPWLQQLHQEAGELGITLRHEGAADSLRLLITLDASAGESYQLSVAPQGIHLQGGAAGIFYGCQTLWQLYDPQRGFRCCRIEDAPRFEWRGLHLDVCRHFFGVDEVKRYIDLLARHKLNRFHWHLTEDQGWRLPVEAYPRLAEISAWRVSDDHRHGGIYTADEIRDVVSHARQRHVTVVPEIEMPGHSVAALAAYPELSCTGGPFVVETQWGIFDDVYCAGKEETFAFLEGVLEETLRLFPDPYVHVGGDECPKTRWNDCPDCRTRMTHESLSNAEELQSYFIRRMAQWLKRRGKSVVGWDEILEGDGVPGATVMCWRGFHRSDEALRKGYDVVLCPVEHCYFDYRQSDHPDEPGNIGRAPLQQVYAFDPGKVTTHGGRIVGLQGNVWTEKMPTWSRVEYMTYPRTCALAELAWSPAGAIEWNHFRTRMKEHQQRLQQWGVNSRPLDQE